MADWTRQGRPTRSSAGLQGQRVHHRRQHAHIVGGGAVDALGRAGQAAKDIAAAHHHADLGAGVDAASFTSRAMRSTTSMSMPKAALAHQRLAGDLEQDPAVFRRWWA